VHRAVRRPRTDGGRPKRRALRRHSAGGPRPSGAPAWPIYAITLMAVIGHPEGGLSSNAGSKRSGLAVIEARRIAVPFLGGLASR